MSSAKDIFETLLKFKNHNDPAISGSDRFLEYCKNTLGGVERLHFDFKEKKDSRCSRLEDDDKKNLAKGTSGFANSSGGVLIWGVTDDKIELKPISNVQEFVTSMLTLVSQLTDPVVPNIDGNFLLDSKYNNGSGYGYILIPESTMPPHRIILSQNEVKNHYYIRSGSSFSVASHTILEDMFGRMPKPKLDLNVKYQHHMTLNDGVRFNVLLGIENNGRGVAKFPFLSIKLNGPYTISRFGLDGNNRFGLNHIITPPSFGIHQYGASQENVIHSNVIHYVTSIGVEIKFGQSIELIQDLVINYKIGAEGIALIEKVKTISGKELRGFIEGYQ